MTIERDKFSDSGSASKGMESAHIALSSAQPTIPPEPDTSGGINLRHYLDEVNARVPIYLAYPFTIVDTPRDDVMNGTAAGERMSGNAGNDTFHGLGGDDYLEGGNGNDTLYGDEGNDFIDSGHNQDSDAGGPGDDLYGLYPPELDGQDTIVEQPGEGFDFIICSADTYTLPANVEGLILHIDGGDGFGREGIGNELDNVIQGTFGPNNILGMAGDDLLLGDAGADTIDGGSGDDWIEGGDGDDMIFGSAGADILLGGAGADTFDFRGIGFRPGFVQQIYGGDTSSLDTGAGDVLKLPGAATDYTLSLETAQGDVPGRTVITHIATGAVIYTQGVARISYGSAPSDNGTTVQAVDDVLVGREEDTPVDITQQNLIENDIRQPGAPLTITRVDSGTHGTIVMRSSGDMIFTPDKDFFGDATFSYVVTDGVSSSTGHVVIHVKPVNDAPDDILLSDNIIADGAKGTVIGALSAHDVDSTNFTFSIVDRVSEFRVVTENGRQMLALADGFSLSHDQTPEITVKIRVVDDANPVGAYDKSITLIVNAGLFSSGVDKVDFNHLTAAQVELAKGGNLYDARDGNDIVTLPDKVHYQQFQWDNGRTFSGAAGNDTITGGDGNDIVDGGAGNDIIIASAGNDKLNGGDGQDIFDYRLGFAGFAAGTSQSIDGGDNPGTSFGLQSQPDTLLLPGVATHYRITELVGATPAQTVTGITQIDGPLSLSVTNVEKLVFSGTPTNQVHLPGSSTDVTGGYVIAEMVRLAGDVYSANHASGFHSADPLLNDVGATHAPGWGDQTLGISNDAEQRGWHALSAMELGLASSGKDASGLAYAFAHGSYQAINPLLPSGFTDTAEANAMVLVGVVDGKVTLSLSFRGTDQLADFGDYLNFTSEHYAKFAPLIAAIDAYVADPANGIQQVLVDGHSLGAGMVQNFMASHADGSHGTATYRAVTIGSPGSDDGHTTINDARMINFVHTDDPVPNLAPGASQGANLLGNLMLMFADPTSKVIGALLETIQPKAREGDTILLDIPFSNNLATGLLGLLSGAGSEHGRNLYRDSVDRLVAFANDPLSPFAATASNASELATILGSGQIGAGAATRIALGLAGDRLVEIASGDAYALGSNADDLFVWPQLGFTGRTVIDGGLGQDSVVLPGLKLQWGDEKVGDHYTLSRLGVHVADLYRVEKLVFHLFSDTILERARLEGFSTAAAAGADTPVVYLDGSTPKAQNIADGDSAISVDATADYVTTGNGNRIITGSSADDFIILGTGHQSVDAGSGNDIVNAQLAGTGSVIAVRGGAGDDTIIGTAAIATTALFGGDVDDYGAVLNAAGALVITDLRDGSPDGTDTLIDVTTLGFADTTLSLAAFERDHLVRFLTGSDGADHLQADGPGRVVAAGGAGDDVLIGSVGDDVLNGGSGADHLYGGSGNDTFAVDRPDDLVFENAGEGTDTVISTAGYYLYANIENLALATGAGDIFGVGNDLNNVITGNEGSNLLIAGTGDDIAHGGDGVDSLFGQDGNDHLYGDAGVDYLVGGNGDDEIDGGTGADALYGEAGNDILWGGMDFQTDILVGGAGNDVLHGDSRLGDYDLLDGGAGDDIYYVDTPADLTFEAANGGNDTVFADIVGAGYYLYANVENLILLGNTPYGVGNELANTLTGNATANYLLGGAGDDILNGKAGNDVLFGEAGADTFLFEHGTGGDVIGDFTPGTDKIDLTAIGYSWAQVQNSLHENGGNTAIDLGGGDLVVLNGVTAAQLHAGDFLLAGGGASAVQGAPEVLSAYDTPGGSAAQPALAGIWTLEADSNVTGINHFVEPAPINGSTIVLG